jgi:CDGSH-type Zn-finger protein
MAEEVQITVTENGPYKVTGPIEIVDHDGRRAAVPGEVVFLCRCGGSMNKPFCDGTHSKIGFEGAMAAVEAADQD